MDLSSLFLNTIIKSNTIFNFDGTASTRKIIEQKWECNSTELLMRGWGYERVAIALVSLVPHEWIIENPPNATYQPKSCQPSFYKVAI